MIGGHEGSGIVLDDQGHVLTTQATLRGGSTLYVQQGGHEFEARLVGRDGRTGLADRPRTVGCRHCGRGAWHHDPHFSLAEVHALGIGRLALGAPASLDPRHPHDRGRRRSRTVRNRWSRFS